MPRSDRSLNKTTTLLVGAEFTELQPDASLRVDVEQARAVAEMYDAVTA